MLMADVAIWTALFVGLMVVLPAVWLVFGALWPSAVQRAQDRIPRRPYLTFFVGLGVTVLFVLVVAILGKANLAAPALIVSSFALGWSLLGVSALARHVGSRLASPGDPAWKPHLRGGIALALSFLAATLAVFKRAPAPIPPVPAPAPRQAVKEDLSSVANHSSPAKEEALA